MKKIIFLLMVAISGCSASGEQYSDAKIPASSVIVYRPGGIIGFAGTYTVNINAEARCQLHNSSFYIDKNTGNEMQFTASRFLAPGTTKLTLHPKQGQTYYVRMEDNTAKSASVIGGGYIGMAIGDAVSDNSGPYIFTLVDPQAAKEEIKSMHLERECPNA